MDIKGLNKCELLHQLWLGQKPAEFFGGSGPSYDSSSAKEAVEGYIDYYCGRAIKMDLSNDTVDPYLYDRDSKVKFNSIVEKMRSK